MATLAQPPDAAGLVQPAPLPLHALVDNARQALGRERRSLSETVAARCAELAKSPSRRNADLLLSLVEGKDLFTLVGPDGRSCWMAATEALLSMGYPYALEIPPEALEQYRRGEKTQEQGGLAKSWMVRFTLLVLLLLFALLFVHL